jgi:hypothetical protein
LLRRSFPKADIETVAQHFNTPEVCFAGQSTNSLHCSNDPNIGGLSRSVNGVADHYRTHTGASRF